jgi:hypothetical protein
MYELGSLTWNQLSENWFQKIIVSKTSRIIYSYHYKGKTGKPCVVIELNTPISRQLSAYALIEKDLRDALSFLEEHQKILHMSNPNDKGILVKALARAIVITYGKCFTKADGRKTKLESDHVSEKNKKTHENMMRMRNKYVAHAGDSEHENCKCIFLLPPEKKYLKGQITYPTQFTELSQAVSPPFIALECKSLMEDVHATVVEKLNSLLNKTELKDITPEEFYRLPKNKSNRIVLNEEDLKRIINCRSA